MTVVLVVGLVAAFWLAVAGLHEWFTRLRDEGTGGRHRATTGPGYTPPADDLPPIPTATRQQLREASR